MRRNNRFIALLRSKLLGNTGPFASVDGQPLMPTCDYFSNLWVAVAPTGAFAGSGANAASWSITNAPVAAAQATVTQASAGLLLHNVLTSLGFSVNAVAAQATLTFVARDGASGVGAILWSQTIGPFAIGGHDNINITGLNIKGSVNTQMTVEFTAAPAATNFESVAATGFAG